MKVDEAAFTIRWQQRDKMVVNAITPTGIAAEELSKALRVSVDMARRMLRHARDNGHIACVIIGVVPKWFLMRDIPAAKAERKRLQAIKAAEHKESRRQAKIRWEARQKQTLHVDPLAGEVPVQLRRSNWEPVKVPGPRSVFELA